MNKLDFHMHSNYSSDGEYSCEQLIHIARERGLEYIALCDHDQVVGVKQMQNEGRKYGIHVIPGIECSTLFDGEFDCHLLGYGIDVNASYFQTLHDRVKQLMEDAFYERVRKLETTYGLSFDIQKILTKAKGKNPWFALCDEMFQDPKNATIKDFKPYIQGGERSDPAAVNFYWDKCQKGSPLYVRVEFPSFQESVKEIHKAGGIAVLAHPFQHFYNNEKRIEQAISFGIDGIEVYSNYHSPKQIAYYHEIAKKYHLLATCGSDFHGSLKPSIKMGEYGNLLESESDILAKFLIKLGGNYEVK